MLPGAGSRLQPCVILWNGLMFSVRQEVEGLWDVHPLTSGIILWRVWSREDSSRRSHFRNRTVLRGSGGLSVAAPPLGEQAAVVPCCWGVAGAGSLVLATLAAALPQMGGQAARQSCCRLLAWGSRLGGSSSPSTGHLTGQPQPCVPRLWLLVCALQPRPCSRKGDRALLSVCALL